MTSTAFSLRRNPFGRLTLTTVDGQDHDDVRPVRAFPIQAPDDGIGMVCPDGREVAWIDRLSDLPPAVNPSAVQISSGSPKSLSLQRSVQDASGW